MKIQKLKISELKPFEKNTRIHTKRNLDTIKKSLQEFGQTKPIVVKKDTYQILCGNGTYEAARALGWEQIDCHVIEIDDEKAKALMIVDNRSSDLSQMDQKAVLDLLQEFDKDMLDLTGYDDQELDNMLKFQQGTLFEEQKKKEKKPKQKKQTLKEAPVSADDQISFILMGYPFVLADPDQIKEIKDLMDKFTTKNIQVRCETTFAIWNAIKDTLRNSVQQQVQNEPDMSIETDKA